MIESIEAVQETFVEQSYIADRALATTIYLAHHLNKPIFLEGEPGVGKTEVAKVLASATGGNLIRLQCYEGLDVNSALYEWNYTKQILQLRIDEIRGMDKQQIGEDIFSEEFLLKRPLLEAIQTDGAAPPVLLIDEVDRSDSEFEAFLLEILSDFQITIPEIGDHSCQAYSLCGADFKSYARDPRSTETSVPLSMDRLSVGPEGVRNR